MAQQAQMTGIGREILVSVDRLTLPRSRTAKKTGIPIWPTASDEIEGQLSHLFGEFHTDSVCVGFGSEAGIGTLQPAEQSHWSSD